MTSKKFDQLKAILKKYPGVIVAFSGGVDSTLLLKIAQDVLKDRVIAVTAVSAIHPKNEITWAKMVAKKLNCKHIIFHSKEFKNKAFISNPKNRCYYCKIELFKTVKGISRKYGYTVIEASNKSDLSDYRPGLNALKKLGVESPFIKIGIDKKEIRQFSKKLDLPNWNKPSMACLASRIPYGRVINKKTLKRIESAEIYLAKFHLTQIRARDHYPIVRIEILGSEFKIILKHRVRIIKYLKILGYKYVVLDLEGYQTGSLNR